jgi:hypothetical protein
MKGSTKAVPGNGFRKSLNTIYMNKLVQRSFLNALSTTAYVTVIATFLFNANKIFAPKDTAFAPMAALMLLVLSAAVTGSLVVGKPLLMFLNGQKSEAVKLFIYTVCWLALATIIFFLFNIQFK